MKSASNFSATLQKKNGVLSLEARTADLLDDLVSFDFLTGNSSKAYQHYILFLIFHCFSFLRIEWLLTEKGTTAKTLILPIDDGTMFLARTEEWSLLIFSACEYVQNPINNHPFHEKSSTSREKVLYVKQKAFVRNATEAAALFFAFVKTAAFKNRTTSATMEGMFFNTVRLHHYDPTIKQSSAEGAASDCSSPRSGLWMKF